MPTVRVRIAVAVDPQGNWNAAGWRLHGRDSEERERLEAVLEGLSSSEESVFWVEATLPIPEIQTVEGEAVAVKNVKDRRSLRL